MGVSNLPEIFQEKMNKIFHLFEFIQAYIDELLVITKYYLSDHLDKLEKMLQKTYKNGLKCNIYKYFFGQTEM